MEIKVSVDGIPRVVCGITEQTTCQEVVIALAQALGRTGRYTLKEKFKEYERNVAPEERLLESLRKYGEQVREVQLTLHHNGPSLGEAGPGVNTVQLRGGRYQSGGGAQLRRAHIGHGHRASEGRSLNRQSLPPLSHLRFHSDSAAEEPKKPKRKSLTLMEEARGWLESLGRSGKQQSGLRDKAKGRDDNSCGGTSIDRGNRLSQSIFDPTAQVIPPLPLPQGRNRRERGQAYELPKVISCLGTQSSEDQVADKKRGAEAKAQKSKKKGLQANLPFLRVEELHIKANQEVEDEKEELRKLILRQQSSLLELQTQVDTTDGQISELEEQQAEEYAAQQSAEAQLCLLEEEAEQLDFWENELKAEVVFERDLLQQFLELKKAAAECKAKLQEYQRKLEGLDLSSSLANLFPQSEVGPKQDGATERPNSHTSHSTVRHAVRNTEIGEHTCPKQNVEKSEGPPVATKPPRVFVAPVQATDSRMSERSQLREWWARWSAGQGSTAGTKPKAFHRSEITIQLNSTRV
ncbi:ras association domain-containing protein 8 [Alosa sapidissima]|uniref:ras association domain-containing protein 8 n=1 Tax=Alosa sapidissima TaxID=34773 RepID=UPI001C0969E4|nr:ras association domain-containing protein 8 [Alosa sapidissima]